MNMTAVTRVRNLHFLLRYSDRLRQVDTLKAHQELAERYGAVWWGKFGLGVSADLIEHASRQLREQVPTFVYLLAGKKIRHRARLLEIFGGGVRVQLRPKDVNLIPAYYRNEVCSVWFRLNDFRALAEGESRHLMLFNEPYARPKLTGMRGLVYVTHPSNIVLGEVRRDA